MTHGYLHEVNMYQLTQLEASMAKPNMLSSPRYFPVDMRNRGEVTPRFDNDRYIHSFEFQPVFSREGGFVRSPCPTQGWSWLAFVIASALCDGRLYA